MSHTVELELEVKDLQSLEEAATSLGLEFVHGQKTHKTYTSGKCDHAIRIPNKPGAYEVGVVKHGENYRLAMDFWNGGYGLMEAIGPEGNKLKQAYTTQYSVNSWQKKGYRVTATKVQQHDGMHVEIEATR